MILLDVDGVLCNWVQGIIDTHNFPINHDEWTSWDHHSSFMSDEDLWAPTYDGKWWENLKPYPWAHELFKELYKRDEVIFCTSPNWDSTCPTQKINWLREYHFLGCRDTRYQIGSRKELNAKSGAILIDDYPENIYKYRGAGGTSILFPQPWNKIFVQDKIGYVINCLDEL